MVSTQLISDVERLAESLGSLPEPVAEPRLVVVSGLPGTGKSYFCARLAERLPLVILGSDDLRRVLFPSPTYNVEESSRLFRAIHLLIERLLRRGISLILDATNLSERHREYLYSIVDHLGVKLVLVRVKAPSEVARERIKTRSGNPENKSDADWPVYQKMRVLQEKIQRQHYVVDTSRDITVVLGKIVREVNR